MKSIYTLLLELFDYFIPSSHTPLDRPMNEDLIRGKSLQIYWHLLTAGPKGVREIQRDLNLTSPSSVSFQLDRLMKAGIVSKDESTDKYFVSEEVKTGILGFYVRFGYRMIPRLTLFLLFQLTGIVVFLILFLLEGDQFALNPFNLLAFIYLILSSLWLMYESTKINKLKPKELK